jgi:hypothetical protein
MSTMGESKLGQTLEETGHLGAWNLESPCRTVGAQKSRCNDAGKTRDPNPEAYGSAWENHNLRSIDTYRSCTRGLQKTAYLHLRNIRLKYMKAREG